MNRYRPRLIRGLAVTAFVTIASSLFPLSANAELKGVAGNATAADQRSLLAAVCTGGVKGSTCRKCPSYTAGDYTGSVSIDTMRVGSFTAPKIQEALVTIVGCEPHVNSWLGTTLLRKTKGRWKMVRYDAGVDVSTCLSFPYQSAGVALLVCEGGWAGQGVTVQSVNAIYVGPTESTIKHLLIVQDNSGACQPTVDVVSVTAWAQRDIDGDKIPDLSLSVDEAHATNPKSGECQSEQKAGKSARYDLIFRFDGTRFTATNGSKETVKCLDSEGGPNGKYCPVPQG